jgi:hypothetical protein
MVKLPIMRVSPKTAILGFMRVISCVTCLRRWSRVACQKDLLAGKVLELTLPVMPKFVAKSDPAAQWTGAHKGHALLAYTTNYLIDTDHGVIVDVEATRAIR